MKNKIEKGHGFVTDWQLEQPSPRSEFPWRGAAIIAVVLLMTAVLVWAGCSVVRPIVHLGDQRNIELIRAAE
jgi:hypothetical protein